jgi:hypothetical protein
MRKSVRAGKNKAANVFERDAPCQCVGGGDDRLKAKTAIFLPTMRARAGLHLTTDDIQVIAPHTAKRSAPAFPLKAGMIAAIVVKPQANKNGRNQQTVDERNDLQTHVGFNVGSSGEIELAGNNDRALRQSPAIRSTADIERVHLLEDPFDREVVPPANQGKLRCAKVPETKKAPKIALRRFDFT